MSLSGAVLLCTLALAAAMSSRRCLPPMGEHPFNATMFSGSWFVVAALHTNTKLPVLPPCVKVAYSVSHAHNVTRVAIEVTSKVGDQVKVIASSWGEPVDEGRDAILLSTWRNDKNESMGEVLQQSVLGTDYGHFAVFYTCVPFYLPDADVFSKKEVVHVLSRLPKINDALIGPITGIIKGFDLPAEGLSFVDNTGC